VEWILLWFVKLSVEISRSDGDGSPFMSPARVSVRDVGRGCEASRRFLSGTVESTLGHVVERRVDLHERKLLGVLSQSLDALDPRRVEGDVVGPGCSSD
jgi:hypothetical protein